MISTFFYLAVWRGLASILAIGSPLASAQQDPAPPAVAESESETTYIKRLTTLPGESACPRNPYALTILNQNGEVGGGSRMGLDANQCSQCHASSPGIFQAVVSFTPPTGDLGASLSAVEAPLRSQLKLPEGRGVLVASLAADGPASRAGLKENDILLSLGDEPVSNPEDVLMRLKAVGETSVNLSIIRDGAATTLQVRPLYRITLAPAEPETPEFYIGVSVAPVDASLRAHLKALPLEVGLIITQVVEDSPAGRAGLQVNDILLSLDETPLVDFEKLAELVQAAAPDPVQLSLLRGGELTEVEVAPEERPKTEEALRYVEAMNAAQNHESLLLGLDPNKSLQPVEQTDYIFLSRPVPAEGQADPAVADAVGLQRAQIQSLVDSISSMIDKKNAEASVRLATEADNRSTQDRIEELSAELKVLGESLEVLRKAVERISGDGGR